MNRKSCSCGCCGGGKEPHAEYRITSDGTVTLAELPVGATARVVKILPQSRGRKKFADVGLVPGAELLLEAQAPFGGLLRVKVLEASMALHKADAEGIILEQN